MLSIHIFETAQIQSIYCQTSISNVSRHPYFTRSVFTKKHQSENKVCWKELRQIDIYSVTSYNPNCIDSFSRKYSPNFTLEFRYSQNDQISSLKYLVTCPIARSLLHSLVSQLQRQCTTPFHGCLTKTPPF